MRKQSKRMVLAIITVAWSILFQPFAEPIADAVQLKRVPNAQVFDVNNKLLGLAESFQGDGDVQVILKMDKSVFFVRVPRTGFTSEETLYYESTDCSGPALDDVDRGEVDILPEGIIGLAAQGIVVASTAIASESRTGSIDPFLQPAACNVNACYTLHQCLINCGAGYMVDCTPAYTACGGSVCYNQYYRALVRQYGPYNAGVKTRAFCIQAKPPRYYGK